MAAHPSPKADIGTNMCAIASNLLNTCNHLAKNSSSPSVFFDKQLAIALYGRNLCLALRGVAEDAGLLLNLYENLLRGLVFAELNLTRTYPEKFDVHANAGWDYLREYHRLADEVKEPDIQQRCDELGIQLRALFNRVNPKWSTPSDEIPVLSDESDPALLIDRLKRARERARSEARKILDCGDSEQQLKALDEVLSCTYEGLAASMSVVIKDIGLNHHVCRQFAALGAFAGGRLGTLATEAIFPWLMSVEKLDEGPQGHRKEIRRRQQLPSLKHFNEESRTPDIGVN